MYKHKERKVELPQVALEVTLLGLARLSPVL